jgi:hypothetical protein
MSLLRHYVRASGDPHLIAAVAAKLLTDWDSSGECVAPDGTRRPEAHAATILGILSTGADTAMVQRYLRLAEESAFTVARSTGQERHRLAYEIWDLMSETAARASLARDAESPSGQPSD